MKRFSPILLGLVVSLGPGCGGAIVSRRPDPIAPDRARELDTLEENIAREQSSLEDLDPLACPERCHSVEGICEASERICEIASEMSDESVRARCVRASQACDEARNGSTGCACASSTGSVAGRDACPVF